MNRPVVIVAGRHRNAQDVLMEAVLRERFELVSTRWAILHRRAAIVHVNTALGSLAFWGDCAYIALAKLLGAAVVCHIQDVALPPKPFKASVILKALARQALMMPDLLMVTGGSELDAAFRLVPRQRIVALRGGVDRRPFRAVPTVRSLPDHPLRLAYLGPIEREAGLYETFQGLRLSRELGVDARLVIAGVGPEEARLRRYAQALGVASRIYFVGALSGAGRAELFGGCDATVVPGYLDNLPSELLESMVAGIPVIATRVGAIPEVVIDGTHGVLVPPRDGKAIAEAIATLAGDRERLTWMSRACRLRIEAAFSMERMARELAVHYASLCGDAAMEEKEFASSHRGARPTVRRAPEEIKD